MKLLCGVGITDADYKLTFKYTGGKIERCPYYVKWKSMVERVYSARLLKRNPTYVGCVVTEEWHSFMNFRAWMIEQDWEGKHLDKDLLVKGNKVYGPSTCVFVSQDVNKFLCDSAGSRGKFKIGVTWDNKNCKFRAKCGKHSKHLGRFDTEEEAHAAYINYKKESAAILADKQTNKVVALALLNRYDIEVVDDEA